MKFVQPIRDLDVIEGMKEYLKQTNERDYIFFCLGIYTGLRVSDLLMQRVHSVKGTHIKVVEAKTGKEKKSIIPPDFKPELYAYIQGKKDDDFLFPSRQVKRKSKLKGRPIHRSMAYRMLNNVAQRFSLSEIGCHTLRKTYGYHLYMANPESLAYLMDAFNHSHETITLRYLGLSQDRLDAMVVKALKHKKK